jgi:coenzyme Q-binding protein COQ10
MQSHAEKKHLPHTSEQMFQLVSDVEKYSEFLPWCISTRIRSQEGNELIADMVIGYKMFREGFTSKVTLTKPKRIDVTYSHGPFKYLYNHWIFKSEPDGSCIVDFYVEFEFRSYLMEKIIGVVFNEAVKKMVHSFEKRAISVFPIHK